MTGPTFLSQAENKRLTLGTFRLDDLAGFTREGIFPAGDSADFRQFDVGRDDVHGVLKYLHARCSRSEKLSMFGYDDDELNAIIERLIESQHVYFQGTLDQSQSYGKHEKRILDAMGKAARSSFVIRRTPTGQIEHTKGGVLDGMIAFEGSTNWSASGEGVGIGLHGEANAKGYKAQANTLTVFTNPVEVRRFEQYLDEQHTAGLHDAVARGVAHTAMLADAATGRGEKV